nr:uncharacterized protein LOC109778997 [Aegilops tauschii subsp. strangulata]
MVPTKRFSATEKGMARQEGPGSPPPPPKRGRGRPRKHIVTPAVAPWGRGRTPSGTGVVLGGRSGASSRGGGHSRWGSPCTEGAHHGRPASSAALPFGGGAPGVRRVVGEAGRHLAPAPALLCRRAAGHGSRRLLVASQRLLQQGLMGRSGGFRLGQRGPGPRLADVRLRARPEQELHPPLQV